MAVIARLNGEIAGISNDDFTTEAIGAGSTLDVLPAGVHAGTPARQSQGGMGGAYFFGSNSATSREGRLVFDVPSREIWGFTPIIRRSSDGTGEVRMEFHAPGDSGGTTDHAAITFEADGRITLRTDNIDRVTSVGSIPVDDTSFASLWVYLLIDNTSGIFQVFDSDPAGGASPFVEWLGDTLESNASAATVGNVNMIFPAGTGGDDFKFQNVSVRFTSGSGGIAIGDTVLFLDGGATTIGQAVIDGIDGDITGTGVLYLNSLEDGAAAVWDGIRANDPTQGTASLARSGGGWTATPRGEAAIEHTSGFPIDTFQVAVIPDANGTVTQLTSSTANPNWDNVDDGLDSAAETDYNSTSTPGDADRYELTALPATGLVQTVDGLSVYLRVREDGGSTINNVAALAYDGTEEEGLEKTIPSGGFQVQRTEFAIRPNGSDWDHTSAEGGQYGIRMKG